MKRIPLIAYFSANLISLIGNNLTLIAVPWFVLETTGSAFQTGLVAFFTALRLPSWPLFSAAQWLTGLDRKG